jgi:polysaccharide biosynthesis transport protein
LTGPSSVATDREFDLIEFGAHLRKQWRWLALTCGIAVTAAAGISLSLPKRYTATASVLIEPPAGNDPRASTALSPVYLDSLKTFERIASNDSLFVEALRHLRIPEASAGKSVESLKRSILNVSKPANTKILEITVTLEEPRLAQALAQYIADRTAALSRSVDTASEEDVTRESRNILAAAESRFQKAQAARDGFTASEPVQTLEDDVASAGEVETRIRRDLADGEAQLAEYTARQKSPDPEGESAAIEVAAIGARVEQLRHAEAEARRAIESEGLLLERRKSQREALEAELGAARTEYEAAKNKLNDIRASAVFRGERLEVIDPGIVPNRPSSPNLPLNFVVALVLSLVAAVGVSALQFGLEERRVARRLPAYSANWER